MKWIRRIFIFLLLVIVLLLIASAAGYKMLHGTPQWYKRLAMDDAARNEAANRADQKLIATATQTQRAQMALRFPNSHPDGPAAATVDRTLELSLTEDELNAFFAKWDQQEHISDRYARFFREPQLILHENHLMLAANATELDAVVSAEFAPAIREGKLDLKLVSVRAGNLPLPQSFWDRYRTRLLTSVQAHLPLYERSAGINPDGSANESLVNAVMGKLFIQAMNDQPADPTLFVPYANQSFKKKYLPVRLTGVSIDQKVLHLSFAPLTPTEREALVASIVPEKISSGSQVMR